MNRKLFAASAAIVVGAVLLAGCSADSGAGPSPADTAGGEEVLGTPSAATGTPITAGMVNIESGPIAFPQLREGVEAAISYVNEYRNGLGGHPLALVDCASDGLPETAQRCANQILDEDPAFIFGAADTGTPGSFPVWEGADLAVIGGVPFTPVEGNYPKAFIFTAVGTADLVTSAMYAHETGAETVAILYTDTTVGAANAAQASAAAETLGMKSTTIPVPPTAADVSAQAATVVSAAPDAVINATPAGCASMLKSLKQLGYAGQVYVLDNCTSPDAIAAAGDAAEGMMWAGPGDLPTSGTEDADLFVAIMAKYAPDTPLDSLSAVGVQQVLNAVEALSASAEDLTTDAIVKAFTTGSDHENFLAHPYTCDGKQLPGFTSVCNAYERVSQWSDGKATTLSDWLDPAEAIG